MFSLSHLRASALVALLAAAPVQAATYNAAQDWQDGSLGGPWSYGWDDGATGYSFRAFDTFSTYATYMTWQYSTYTTLSAPSAVKNTGSTPLVGVASGAMALHPGPETGDTTGDAAVLRWTAPTTAAYTIHAQFDDGDFGETQAWVVLNGKFGTPLADLGFTSLSPVYQSTLALTVGDTVDFLVGNSGDFYYDTTAVAVTVSSPVPEPGMLAMLLAGLGLVASRRRQGMICNGLRQGNAGPLTGADVQ